MIEIKAPNPLFWDEPASLFLAGSIEMGTAEDWQRKVIDGLRDSDVAVLNPRRDNWDPTWEQSTSNPKFVEQVTWELNALDHADFVVFYFDPNTKSPITLLELGLCAGLHADSQNIIVCCPDGYWRKGNVDIVCDMYGLMLVKTIDDLISTIVEKLV
jgi:hypothetical protein